MEIALFNGLPSLWHCWDAITRVELDPSPADTLFVNHHIFNTNHTLNVAIATCQQFYKYVMYHFNISIFSFHIKLAVLLICTQDIPTVARVPGKLGPDSWASGPGARGPICLEPRIIRISPASPVEAKNIPKTAKEVVE